MRNIILFQAVTALPIAALLVAGGPAVAKQRDTRSQVSYDRAWSICREFVAEEGLTWDQTQQRSARMGACMKNYGYQL